MPEPTTEEGHSVITFLSVKQAMACFACTHAYALNLCCYKHDDVIALAYVA